MKRASAFGMIAAALWLAAGHAAAPPGPPDAASVLRAWDAARRRPGDSHQKFTRREIPGKTIFGGGRRVTKVFRGEVSLRWPDRLRVEVKGPDGCPVSLYLATPGEERLYYFDTKEELALQLPVGVRYPRSALRCNPMPGLASPLRQDEVLWPALGPPTRGLDARFACWLEKEDAHWSYLTFEPKQTWIGLPDERWRVVLHREGRWLRRLSTEVGADRVTVDFEEPSHKPLPDSTWEPPFNQLPKGWERTDDAALRKIRGE